MQRCRIPLPRSPGVDPEARVAPNPAGPTSVRAGKVKLLGVASERKSPFFPDAPTCADLGIKKAGPAIRERFNTLGAEPVALETPAFRKLLAGEGRTPSTLIRERNIVAE